MANELTLNITARISNDEYRFQFEKSAQFTQDGRAGDNGVHTITTTEAVVPLPKITTPGWVFFHNLDQDNYVTVGPESAGAMVPFLKIQPREFGAFRLDPSVVLRAQANTASVPLQLDVQED